ncbi:MAG: type II secretion system F family protein [Dehalococcoidia bacterium]
MLFAIPLLFGLFISTLALWFFGFGTHASAMAGQRLARLTAGQEGGAGGGGGLGLGLGSTLRRRTNVSLGGVSFVNAGVAQKWTVDLERAGLSLNAKEYLILRIAVSLAIAAVGATMLPMPIIGFAISPLGFLGVGFWLKRRITKRRQTMEGQLAELLQMLASGLRAGFGLVQAMEQAADQMPAPISVEMRRAMRDMAMGASVEQALGALDDRVGSKDFDIVITAILIQRAVGGNLAEILDNVAHTMRERERIRGEIRTLTSQQRLTGYVIGGIPIGLLVIFNLISPEFAQLLFTDSWGHMMLAVAGIMECIGFFIINRIVNIEV